MRGRRVEGRCTGGSKQQQRGRASMNGVKEATACSELREGKGKGRKEWEGAAIVGYFKCED